MAQIQIYGTLPGGGPDNAVTSDFITTIWKGTQAEYDAIDTKDENTMYLIEKE